jgi:hypothetical protein
MNTDKIKENLIVTFQVTSYLTLEYILKELQIAYLQGQIDRGKDILESLPKITKRKVVKKDAKK